MTILMALVLVETTSLLLQDRSSDAPKRPDQPFRILIFAEPRGEPEAVARVREAEQECRKIVKRKKGWFVAVDDREQAEIVMEIKGSWMEEYMTAERSPMSNTRINIMREHHYVFADVIVLGGQFGLRADDRRSVKGAASRLIDALEDFCKKNYWEILQRREKRQSVSRRPHHQRLEWMWPSLVSE